MRRLDIYSRRLYSNWECDQCTNTSRISRPRKLSIIIVFHFESILEQHDIKGCIYIKNTSMETFPYKIFETKIS